MSSDLQNANVLLTKYEKLLVKTLTECGVVHKDFTVRQWSGDFVEFPIHMRRSDAFGGGTDGSEYRDPSHRSYQRAAITRAFIDASAGFSEGIMEASDGENSYVNKVQDELEGIAESLDCGLNSLAFGDGSGQIGVVGAVSTNTITVDMDGGLFLPQLLNFPGARVEVRSSAGTVSRGIATIEHVGAQTGSPTRVGLASSGAIVIELDAAPAGTTAGDILVWAGGGRSSFGLMPEGFSSLVDNLDETFQNIDTGVVPEYSAYVDQNGGTLRTPDIAMIRKALANVRLKTGRKAMDYALYGNPATFANYDDVEATLLRYNTGDSVLGRSIEGVQSNQGGVTFNMENACPDTDFYGLDKAQCVRYEQRPLQFVRRGGDIVFPSTTRKMYFAHMTAIWQNAMMARNSSFKITDLASSTYRAVSFS